MTFTFTVFTPCYNGARTISRVFQSLENQIYGNFEWIIVNDGSTDDSDAVIRRLIERSPIKDRIFYYQQQNKGKHRTWNWAVDQAKGEIFVPADCDDSFKPTALQFFNEKLTEIASAHGGLVDSGFSGVNVCCINPEDSTLVGDPYPASNGDYLDSDNLELAYKYHVKGEHWGCIRTDLLRKYKFPEVNGRFYRESRVWFALAIDGYKVRCFNEPLRAYYCEPKSLSHTGQNDFSRAKMNFRYYLWLLRNGFFRIVGLNLFEGLLLIFDVAKSMVKMLIVAARNV